MSPTFLSPLSGLTIFLALAHPQLALWAAFLRRFAASLRSLRRGAFQCKSFRRMRGGFGGNAGGDLYLRFALTLSKESGAATFHAQAYIPTQPAQAIEDTRISQAHEDPGRQESYFPPARQGAQTGLGKTRFPRIVQWRGRERPRNPLLCQSCFPVIWK